MQTLNNAEQAFLAIISYPDITGKAQKLYADHVMLFTKTFCPHVERMMTMYMQVLKKHKTIKVGKHLIVADISEQLQADESMPEELQDKCDTILQKYVSGDVPSHEEGIELLQKMAKMDLNRKISAKVTQNADLLELQKTLDVSKKTLTEIGDKQEDEKNQYVFQPFKDMDEFAIHTERIPTGINWMDEVTSGGGRAGELWLILGSSGGGKCLHPDTPVLMYDGSVKKAKDIVIGDRLMGPDSTPRHVLQLGKGLSTMYRIIPVKGDPYIVNKQHILTLAVSIGHGKNLRYAGKTYKHGDLIDIPVEEYIKASTYVQSMLKGVRTGVDFPERESPDLDPYFAGLYLGDGSRNASVLTLSDSVLTDYCHQYAAKMGWNVRVTPYTDEQCVSVQISKGKANVLPKRLIRAICVDTEGQKHIHDCYKYGSRGVRLQILAGLLDTDGYMHHGHYEIVSKFDHLATDILFIARSLGYAAYDNFCSKKCYNTGVSNMYHRITISGDFSDLPVRCARNKIVARKQCKSVLHTGITVEELPVGEYCGFVIDGDHRFLQGDFTITHNTAQAVQYACQQALMGNATLWATYEQSLDGDIAERMIACVTDESLDIIRDKGFTNLPEALQKKFWASVAGADDKLHVMDMTKVKPETATDHADNGGMYTIWKKYKELKERGIHVKTIIVDWIGSMMSLVGSVTSKDLANGYRFATQAEIDIARRMVKEEQIQIIFFHQTDSKSQHARPVYVPDKTCAKDMKDMCNYMDIVLTLGIRDVNNVCWISAAKSRKGAAITKTIQLIGDKSRFVAADGWLPNRDGNFYRPGDDFMTEAVGSDDAAASYSREIE